MYLYHATDRKNLNSILEYGLLCKPPKHNWEGMTTKLWDDLLFLALDANVAESYVESQDEAPEKIVVFKISLDDLDEQQIGYDWLNRCEYHDEINSVVYRGDIAAACLSICDTDKEPFQDIDLFKRTMLYDKVMTVFEEEVETNLERR